jgi:hypothetical protein
MPPVPAHVRRQRLVTLTALIMAVIAVFLLVAAFLAGMRP